MTEIEKYIYKHGLDKREIKIEIEVGREGEEMKRVSGEREK